MEVGDLLNRLASKAAKWSLLGIQLGLSPDELDIIRANSQDVEECLRKVLQKWYNRTLHPTWEEIIAALKAMGEMRLVEDLEKLHLHRRNTDDELDTGDEVTTEIVKENLARIKGSFASLVTKISDRLKQRDINMTDFRLYIITLFPPGDIISTASSVAEVCESLSRHQLWGYDAYFPIESIAKKFAEDDLELKGWICDYKSELAGYKAMTKIAAYMKACVDEESVADPDQSIQQNMARYDKRYCCKLTVKLKARVTEKSLFYIDELWMSIADHFFLPCLPVLLDSIHEGCVEVTWCVPTLSALQIQANIQDSTEFFQDHEIAQMIIDGDFLYDEEGMNMKLLRACVQGDLNEVVALLTYGVSADSAASTKCNYGFYTPLTAAASHGNYEVIDVLLDYHPSINKVDSRGFTALTMAALKGHSLVVQILLEHGAEIDKITEDNWTALSCACWNGHLEVVRVLLQHNADVNNLNQRGWTPLMHAIDREEENVDMVRLLLDAGAVINHVPFKGWRPLTIACDRGHINIAKLLIDCGANVNLSVQGFEWTPLVVAAAKQHYDICMLLLDHGSPINQARESDGITPLIAACKQEKRNLIELLLSRGANVNSQLKNGATAMHISCQEGHLANIKLLHENGASLEVSSVNSWTPLMYASANGHEHVVEYLLEQQPSLLNHQDKDGSSSLNIACKKGHSAVVAKLLSHGANTELCGEEGLSSLLLATNKGYIDIVKLLLEASASVNHTEKNSGWSSLLFAAKNGSLAIAKLLLMYGADMSLTPKGSNVTAYDVASIEGHTDICKELEAHGYQSLAPPTETMRHEVKHSNSMLQQSYLDTENISLFREALRGRYRHHEENRLSSISGSTIHPELWEPEA